MNGQRTAALYCSAPMIGSGLRSTLESSGWIVISPSGSTGQAQIAVVLVRTSEGVGEVRASRHDYPDRPVIALTDYRDADLTAEIVGAGATSVLAWDHEPSVLIAAATLALAGVSTIATDALQWLAQHGTNHTSITDAERKWLEELERGITVSQLAPIAGYSERSLYRQLNQLYHRLGASDRATAIAEARRRKLLA